jgi:hypothetical protein
VAAKEVIAMIESAVVEGLGGRGAVSDEAVELCHRHDIAVIEGACPLMFLQPVGFAHRTHRAFRRMNRSVV